MGKKGERVGDSGTHLPLVGERGCCQYRQDSLAQTVVDHPLLSREHRESYLSLVHMLSWQSVTDSSLFLWQQVAEGLLDSV